MTIKTKFEVNQKVFYVESTIEKDKILYFFNDIYVGEILEISTHIKNNHTVKIRYLIQERFVQSNRFEKHLFSTKEKARAFVLENNGTLKRTDSY